MGALSRRRPAHSPARSPPVLQGTRAGKARQERNAPQHSPARCRGPPPRARRDSDHSLSGTRAGFSPLGVGQAGSHPPGTPPALAHTLMHTMHTHPLSRARPPCTGPRRPLTARRGLRRSAEPCPVTPGAPKGWARAEGPGVDGGGLGPPRARGGPAGGRPRSGGRARRAGFARGRQGEAGAARTPQGPRSVGGRALRRSPSKRKMEVGFCEPGQTAVLWDKGLTLGEHAEKAQRWPLTIPLSGARAGGLV